MSWCAHLHNVCFSVGKCCATWVCCYIAWHARIICNCIKTSSDWHPQAYRPTGRFRVRAWRWPAGAAGESIQGEWPHSFDIQSCSHRTHCISYKQACLPSPNFQTVHPTSKTMSRTTTLLALKDESLLQTQIVYLVLTSHEHNHNLACLIRWVFTPHADRLLCSDQPSHAMDRGPPHTTHLIRRF